MKSNKLKEVKGITIIALVVAIIVLLILAAVGLNLTLGKNGIINRGKEATSIWNEASNKEQIALNDLEYSIISSTNNKSDLHISLSQTNNNFTISIDNPKENYEFEFYLDGKLVQKGKESSYSQEIELEDKEPYIPSGFNYMEGNIESGYVIKDKTSGNEFVWIPVKGKVYTAYVKAWDGKDITLQSNEIKISFSQLTRNLNCAGSIIEYTNWHEDEGDINDKKSIAYFKQSVVENGGFYIGRYEMGMPGQKEGDKPTLDFTNEARNIKGTPVCIKGVMPWTNIDYDVAKENLESMYNGEVQSAMLNSYARTTTLNWIDSNIPGNYQDYFWPPYGNNFMIKGSYYIVNYTQELGYGYETDFTSAIDLLDASPSGESLLLETGAELKNSETGEFGFCINNIYDLGGNAGEWSTEINNGDNNHRISGGSFTSSGAKDIDYNSSIYREGVYGNISTSSRPILYK